MKIIFFAMAIGLLGWALWFVLDRLRLYRGHPVSDARRQEIVESSNEAKRIDAWSKSDARNQSSRWGRSFNTPDLSSRVRRGNGFVSANGWADCAASANRLGRMWACIIYQSATAPSRCPIIRRSKRGSGQFRDRRFQIYLRIRKRSVPPAQSLNTAVRVMLDLRGSSDGVPIIGAGHVDTIHSRQDVSNSAQSSLSRW